MRFIFKTRYQQDIAIFKHDGQRLWFGILAIAVLLAPLVLDTFYLGELALVYICAIAGIGLMLLVGYTGLVSLGHAAFLAIGAYTHAILMTNGLPFPASLILAGLVCTVIGAIIGLPAMRMTGIYLAIARAMMLRPDVILLDEPSLGLSPRLVGQIAAIVRRLNEERNVTVLLVEQNAKLALDISHFGYVMELGRIVMEDTSERLRGATDIKEFYLGMKDQGVRGRRRWKQRKTWR